MLLLNGCGQAPPPATGPASSGTVVASEPADAPAGTGDQPPHYADDHRYRERVEVSASAQRVLDRAREDVVARLVALPHPPTTAAVTAVVATTDEGAPWVAEDGDGGIAFESQVGRSGCLIGAIGADGTPDVKTGGFIMDGGCHALTGH